MKNIKYWLLDNKLVKTSLFLGCVIRELNDFNLTLGMHATSRLIDWLIEWMNAGGGGVVYYWTTALIFLMLKFDHHFKGLLYQ